MNIFFIQFQNFVLDFSHINFTEIRNMFAFASIIYHFLYFLIVFKAASLVLSTTGYEPVLWLVIIKICTTLEKIYWNIPLFFASSYKCVSCLDFVIIALESYLLKNAFDCFKASFFLYGAYFFNVSNPTSQKFWKPSGLSIDLLWISYVKGFP